MLSTHPLESDVAALRSRVDGSVVLPGDENWDAARQAWNLAVDQRPAVVAFPLTPPTSQTLVHFAAAHGLRVALQGTGHNASPLGPLDDTMLVKTSEMRGVEIDEAHCIARVEAGALWIDVTAPASEAGLAPLAGSSPDVGVVGYTLGGGLSWLGRRYGLACQPRPRRRARHRRRAAAPRHPPRARRAVLGAARRRRQLRRRHGDRVRAVPDARGLRRHAALPGERAREVLQAWREWTATAPDSVTTSARILQVPPTARAAPDSCAAAASS